MSKQNPRRILGIVYFNPEDSRVIVPRHDRLGWDLNFGHPHAITALGWICAILLVVFVVAPIIAHPLWFSHNLTDIVWWGLAVMTAIGMIRLNKLFAWSNYRDISLASFGILATGIGFPIQGLINGPLMLWWGNNLGWPHHAVLGSVAAAAQTFGKWFALSVLLKVRRSPLPSEFLRCGLWVGLGFTVLEITMLYFRVAWAQISVDYLAIWERASASMFHIYSAGLIAAAMRSRRYQLILLVVGIHALMDFLAGAGGTLGISTFGLEGIFSVLAIFVWLIFLFAVRSDCGTAATKTEQWPTD